MQWIVDIIEPVLPHWPFITVALLIALVGQVIKRLLSPPVGRWRLEQSGPAPGSPLWFRLYWATLPVQPVCAAVLVAFTPIPASPGIEGAWARVGYFALAGILSTWLYKVAKNRLLGGTVARAVSLVPPPPRGGGRTQPPPIPRSSEPGEL